MTDDPRQPPLTEYEQRAQSAYEAIDKFVKEGEWPKSGTLPVKFSFRKRLGQ